MQRYSLLAALLVLALLCACAGQNSATEEAPQYPQRAVSLIAPAGSGSGYDVTMRALAGCLQETGLVRVPLPITNIPGGGGVTALEYLDSNTGADNVLSVYSPPLNLIRLNGSTSMNYRENTTPIARLFVDYGVFAVRSDSPFQTLGEVMDALKENPEAVRLGGISSYGSMDHLQFLKAAHAYGVGNLGQIAYTGYQDGTAVAQLLGGHVDVVSTGISDSIGLVESGDIRALAVTAGKRVGKGLTARIPTCIEQGIDVTFVNWRGLFGPKDMPEYALAYWEETLAQMVETPEWAEICAEYGWDMDYAGHGEFLAFLDEMDTEYAKLLGEIGFPSAAHNNT
jgi:putative tricarboxylic transport membrane protein